MAQQKQIFLSYSRRQFYFAESLVLSLQEAGVPIWFDVQELAPGEPWREELFAGLKAARGIIVVVSQASMASTYVRDEWLPMVEAKLPIYLAIFESAEVPTELLEDATAVIDLRGRFSVGVGRLLETINDESVTHKDPIPKPNRLNLPFRLSFANGFVVIIAVLSVLFLLLAAFYLLVTDQSASGFGGGILLVLYAYYLADLALDIMRRDHNFRQMWIGLVLIIPLMAAFTPVAILLPAFAIIMLLTSSGIYRWLPTGDAPNWMRRRYGVAAAPTLRELVETLDAIAEPQSQPYTITYQSEDTWVAEQIEQALQTGGHQRITEPDSTTQHILVLSHYTPVSTVEGILAESQSTITPVVATNVDARGRVKALGAYQSVDFREHSPDQLEAISTFFRHPEHAKIIYGLNVLPLSSSVARFPAVVRRFYLYNQLLYVFFLIFAFYALGVFTVSLFAPPSIPVTGGQFVWSALLTLVAGLFAYSHYRFARAVHIRSITFRQYRRRLIVLSVVTLTGLPYWVLLGITYRGMRNWLPAEIATDHDGETLPDSVPHAARNRALRIAAIVFVFIMMVILSTPIEDIVSS